MSEGAGTFVLPQRSGEAEGAKAEDRGLQLFAIVDRC